MKLFAFFTVFLVCSFVTFALPPILDVQSALNSGDVRSPKLGLGYQIVGNKLQTLRCTYSFAVQGGAVAAVNLDGIDGADCKLPVKAIVVHAMIDVVTAPTSANSSATIAIGTGQATTDLKAALSISGGSNWTGQLDGIPALTAATAIKMTALRTPSLTVGVSPLTAGKINVFISYIISE